MNLIELYLLTHICFWNVDLRVHPLTTIISPLGDLLSIYPYLQYVKERIRLSSLDFKDTIIFSFFKKNCIFFFVPRVGFEPTTHRLEICCSIQLSYRGIYVFLIKYNKKIKNCFFQRTLVFLTISKILFFFEISNFFLNFFYFFSRNILFLRNFCLCDICNISDKYQHTDSNRD